MEAPVESALRQVIARVEPLTRFDRRSLKVKGKGVRTSSGQFIWRFSPNIAIETQEDKTGPLPSYIDTLSTLQDFIGIASQARELALRELPERLRAWQKKNSGTDRQLESSDCFDGPQTFGYQTRCRNCDGKGWVKCQKCSNGYNTCPACEGKGEQACSKCKTIWGGSSGREKCRGCGGTKKNKKTGQACSTCNARGYLTCTACKGRKALTCQKCAGQGKLLCPQCGGTARLNCPQCAATGFLHSIKTVQCTVVSHYIYKPTAQDEISEVVQQLQARDLRGLKELALVTQSPVTIDGNSIVRTYQSECTVTYLQLQIGESIINIIGFGNNAKIFDFKRVVPILLDADLKALGAATAEASYHLWKISPQLLTATKTFLSSEVNSQIENPAFTAEGIVDQNYVNNVNNYLQSALLKLLLPISGPALGLVGLITIISSVVFFLTNLRAELHPWAFLPPLLLSTLAWFPLENKARSKLTVLVRDPTANNEVDISKLLRKYYLTWKIRLIAAILVVLIIICFLLTPSTWSLL